jgi:hypothetical protein
MELMTWIENLPISVAIAESIWLFPILETIHVFALAIVVGSIGMIDVRLLGLASRKRAVSELIDSILPWTWIAFSVTLIVGLLLFCSKATTYYENVPFRIKLICLALAGTNMLTFHLITAKGIASWDRGVPPLSAKLAGAFSLTLWIAVVTAGRWIGFV